MNERWRVALAGLVAALAVPFLIIDSPAPAGGVETAGQEQPTESAVREDIKDEAVEDVAVEVSSRAVEIVVVNAEITPDISRLSDQAGTWGVARAQAITDGLVAASRTPPPSNTNLALLPVVRITPKEPEAPVDPETPTEPEEPVDPETPTEPEEPVDPETPTEPEEPVDPETPTEPEEPAEPPGTEAPAPPPQVDGRVPPPAGGPTAAQWNALRKCESTHNYRAISPTGLYRGAYQFSQQTWDWVGGIHWQHLVGIDPIDAEPAWQDVMAYTLYAMRGWDQWPICGKNLL